VLTRDQYRQSDQHRAERAAEHQLGALSVFAARLPEGGDPVGDGFDPGQRRAAGGECLQGRDRAECLGDVDRLRGADDRGRMRAQQTDDDDSEDRGEEPPSVL
jgi:hypothetical protein